MFVAITILFGVLSVLVVIGGVLYMRFSDSRSSLRRIKQPKQKTQEFETDKSKKANLKDIWEVTDIRDGIIYMKGNRYAAILKIGSVDIRLLSDDEQTIIENILIRTALPLTLPIQFVVATERVEADNTINDIVTAMNNNDYPLKVKAFARETINYLNELMQNKNINVRSNYLVITYEGELEKAYSELNRLCQIMINEMKSIKIKSERLSSSAILDLLNSCINNKTVKPSEIVDNGGFELYVGGVSNVEEETREN
ncbi:hypothetical protein [Thermoanaerobacterium butyriciformans]|uniref:Uncharacterized protein n=1 Tax=Thermoanaerobacterium butyriciformans TaxID=1702242 RepID=A0ABS4NB16_9THEO|nr:hypothetical protein [Thermoanaerobacterium butyriciformans]MBP2070858.1 hypothetical protein [Thermoanaerobacterium butyriciformans]